MSNQDLSILQNPETEQTTKSPSEEISYVETRTFKRGQYAEMKRLEYPSAEAFTMYQRVIKKYRDTKQEILICLRDRDDQLVRSEMLNNSRATKE